MSLLLPNLLMFKATVHYFSCKTQLLDFSPIAIPLIQLQCKRVNVSKPHQRGFKTAFVSPLIISYWPPNVNTSSLHISAHFVLVEVQSLQHCVLNIKDIVVKLVTMHAAYVAYSHHTRSLALILDLCFSTHTLHAIYPTLPLVKIHPSFRTISDLVVSLFHESVIGGFHFPPPCSRIKSIPITLYEEEKATQVVNIPDSTCHYVRRKRVSLSTCNQKLDDVFGARYNFQILKSETF